MTPRKLVLVGGGIFLFSSVLGCGLVQGHVDCDQVAQQQREGATDAEIAKANALTLDQVQSCSETASSGGRETANNYQDQLRLPAMPVSIPGGAIHP